MYSLRSISYTLTMLAASQLFGGLLLMASAQRPAVAQLSIADQKIACANIAKAIKNSEDHYAELKAIIDKNPKLARGDAETQFLLLRYNIAMLKKVQEQECILHLTMPPPTPTPTLSLKLPPGQQSGVTKPGPVQTQNRSPRNLREIIKTCNELRSDFAQVQLTMQQLQRAAMSAPWGQARAWLQLKNDVAQMAGPIQSLCPPAGVPYSQPH
jgi:hypothetical protein